MVAKSHADHHQPVNKGDGILSDEASMLTGSIGMLPSAFLNDREQR